MTQTIASIVHTMPEHVEALAELQPIAFPNLHPAELLREEHFLNHLKLFPEGQFTALVDGEVVGSTTTMRTDFDFSDPQHGFAEMIDEGWLSNHDPNGEWLYGADMNIHPEYRGYGIGKQLYAARTKLCERLNLRGQIAGGLLPGYPKHAHKLSPHAYCQKVVHGELFDPTLSTQLKIGYRYVGILHDYYAHHDPAHKPAALIVKDNHRYIELDW